VTKRESDTKSQKIVGGRGVNEVQDGQQWLERV